MGSSRSQIVATGGAGRSRVATARSANQLRATQGALPAREAPPLLPEQEALFNEFGVTLDTDQTITGLKTFDRGAAVPFAVAVGSLLVTNLDTEKWNGQTYEQNTWTPTGNGVTLTVTSALYTRIGRQVHVQWDVTWPVTVDGGQARIQGLPFTPMAGWASAGSAHIVSTTTPQPFYGDTNTYVYMVDAGVGIKTNAVMSTLRVIGGYTYFR